MEFFGHERGFVCTKVFFSDRCMFIEDAKDWLLKQTEIRFPQRTKALNFRSKDTIAIVFVVPISNNMGLTFMEIHFKFSDCE